MRSVVLTVILLFTLPLFAQFTFQPVDVPGSVETQVRGINNAGVIVGFYRLPDASCIPFAPNMVQVTPCDQRGFRIVNGKLTTIMVPGSLSTAIMGVNDAGDMVGYYSKTSEACIVEQHAFIWTHHNVIKQFDYPDWTGFCGTDALWTMPFAIDNAGTVVGTVWSPLDGYPSGGFIYKNGAFSSMNPAGIAGGCFTCTTISGISAGGLMVGTAYRDPGLIPMWTGFMKRGDQEVFFNRTQDDTWATGVNSLGDVVGYGVYGAGFFIDHLKRYLHAGSTIVDPALIPIGYPGGVGTYPFAVNNRRIVVGSYMAVDGTLHGFVAVPRF